MPKMIRNGLIEINGSAVEHLREKAMLTRAELAGLCNLSEQTIVRIETHKKKRVQTGTFRVLVQELKCYKEDLLGGATLIDFQRSKKK